MAALLAMWAVMLGASSQNVLLATFTTRPEPRDTTPGTKVVHSRKVPSKRATSRP